MTKRRASFYVSLLFSIFFLSCPDLFQPFTPPEGSYQEPEFSLPSFSDPLKPSFAMAAYDAGRVYSGLAFESGKLYSLSFFPSTAPQVLPLLQVYEAATGVLEATVDLKMKSGYDFSSYDLAFHGTELLVVSPNWIYRFNASDWSYLGRWDPLIEASHQGIAVIGDSAYLSAWLDRTIWRYDLSSPSTGATALCVLPEGASPRGMCASGGIIFVADAFHKVVYRIDASTGAILGQIGVDYREEMGVGDDSGTLYLRDESGGGASPLYWQELPGAVGAPCSVVRSDPVRARVSFRASIQNTGVGTARVRVRAALPRTDAHQEIQSLAFQGSKVDGRDFYGQPYAILESADIPAGGSAILGYVAEARLWTVKYHFPSGFTVDLGALPASERQFFLTDSFSYLSMGNAAVRSFASSVPGSPASFEPFGHAVRNAVFDALEYFLDDEWDDAATVLARGSGSCSEYSFLTSAVWRLRGYPTRFVGASTGSNAFSAGSSVDTVYHRWIEVYAPGVGWIPMDCNHNDSSDGAPYRDELVFGVDRLKLVVLKGGCEDEEWLGEGYISDHRVLSGTATVSRSFQWELLD